MSTADLQPLEMPRASETQPLETPPSNTGKPRFGWLNAIVLGVIVGLLAAGGTWMFLPKAKHSANSTIQIVAPPTIFQSVGLNQTQEAMELSYLAQAKSRFVLNAALKRAALNRTGGSTILQSPEMNQVEVLEKMLKVEFIGPGLMSFTVTGDDPEELIVLANALTEAFIEEVINKQREQLRESFQSIAVAAKKNYEERSRQLQEIAQDNGVKELDDVRARRNKREIIQLFNKNQLNTTRIEIERLEVAIRLGESKDALDDPASQVLLEKEMKLDPEMKEIRDRQKLLDEKTTNSSNPNADDEIKKIKADFEKLDAEEKACRERIQREIRVLVATNTKQHVFDLRERLNFSKELVDALEKENIKLEEEIKQLRPDGKVAINLAVLGATSDVAKEAYMRAEAAYEALCLESLPSNMRQVFVLDNGEVIHGDDLQRRSMSTATAGVGGFLLVLLGVGIMKFHVRRTQSAKARINAILSIKPEPADLIAHRLGMSVEAVKAHLEEIASEDHEVFALLLARQHLN